MLSKLLGTIFLLLLASIALAEDGCIDTPIQEIYDLAAAAQTDVLVTQDGFAVWKDGQCLEAKYVNMSVAQQKVYDDVIQTTLDSDGSDREKRARPGCG